MAGWKAHFEGKMGIYKETEGFFKLYSSSRSFVESIHPFLTLSRLPSFFQLLFESASSLSSSKNAITLFYPTWQIMGRFQSRFQSINDHWKNVNWLSTNSSIYRQLSSSATYLWLLVLYKYTSIVVSKTLCFAALWGKRKKRKKSSLESLRVNLICSLKSWLCFSIGI